MYNKDTEFLFPARVFPELGSLRGEQWQQLVDRTASAVQTDPATLGFVFMMVRLNGCESCDADSFKAIRGCTACSVQTVERYAGSDEKLVALHEDAQKEIVAYLDLRKTDNE